MHCDAAMYIVIFVCSRDVCRYTVVNVRTLYLCMYCTLARCISAYI